MAVTTAQRRGIYVAATRLREEIHLLEQSKVEDGDVQTWVDAISALWATTDPNFGLSIYQSGTEVIRLGGSD